jgi:tRNA/tmRNA/rRNA uracil-C5-methylase (TrmA/RlmC/RlmD family)
VSFVGRRKKDRAPRDFPFPYHTEIELEITTLTNRGVGLGRVPLPPAAPKSDDLILDTCKLDPSTQSPAAGDWVVMVPFSLPGERVRARVFRNQKNFSEADLVAVLTPSADRVEPRCPVFGQCGGCQYQHLNYEGQLVWKRQQVVELLEHMAGVSHPVNPVIGSPEQFGYRSKITPHFQTRPWTDAEGEESFPIGFLKQGTRSTLIDVPQCPIATDAINAKLTEVRAEVQAKLAREEFKKGATLLLRHAEEGVVTEHDAVIHEVIAQPDDRADLRLRFLARDFFQNNPFILSAFTDYVRQQANATGATHLVDAYCGSGLFALALAPSFEQVAGVEISETSVQFATENAKTNGIRNATFIAGDATAIFADLAFDPSNTVMVIDPPRKGCDETFLNQLFAFGPKAVIYVSCDPATQMRDLVHFTEANYTVTDVQPFDLFPQTRHLECVTTLVKD